MTKNEKPWIDVVLYWTSIAYLVLGALMTLGGLFDLLGLYRADRGAGPLIGLGMAGFFLGGVLILLLRIDDKLARIVPKEDEVGTR